MCVCVFAVCFVSLARRIQFNSLRNQQQQQKPKNCTCHMQIAKRGRGIKVNTYASYLWDRERDCITCSAAHYAQRGQQV